MPASPSSPVSAASWKVSDAILKITFLAPMVGESTRGLRDDCRQALLQAAGCREVHADVAAVSALDARGLHLLFALHQECGRRGMVFRLVGVTPTVQPVFKGFHLNEALGVEPVEGGAA